MKIVSCFSLRAVQATVGYNIGSLTALKSRTTPYNSVTTSADDEVELEIKRDLPEVEV